MNNLKIKYHSAHLFSFIVLFLVLLFSGCQSRKKDSSSIDEKNVNPQMGLKPDIEAMADQLIEVRKKAGVSSLLATKYPNLELNEAIKIQMAMLTKFENQGERLVGWKMGGANKDNFSPGFGFMLASDEFSSGSTVSSLLFAEGSPLVEVEIGFVLKSDLRGPISTHEDVVNAIEGVGGFCELISNRTKGRDDDTKPTFNHLMADGLSHGGFIRAKHIFKLDEVDFENENGAVNINADKVAEGNSNKYDLIKAVLYLANKLPKYGRYLHAGDIIITGSIVTPPPANKGDKIEILFSTFDKLSLELN